MQISLHAFSICNGLVLFLSVNLLAWLESIQRAGPASAPSHIFPRQTSQFPLFDLHSSSYHCVASVFLFSALWASFSKIMLPTGIFLSASSFSLVLRSSTIYHNVVPGPLEQTSLQVSVIWSQVTVLFATIMGPQANLTH